MSGDLDLFGNPASDDAEDAERTVEPTPAPVARWQIDLLRKALTARGLAEMDERQKAISEAVGRPVDSLHALTQTEALQALKKLSDAVSSSGQGSAWDERDEDTWIDRL